MKTNPVQWPAQEPGSLSDTLKPFAVEDPADPGNYGKGKPGRPVSCIERWSIVSFGSGDPRLMALCRERRSVSISGKCLGE